MSKHIMVQNWKLSGVLMFHKSHFVIFRCVCCSFLSFSRRTCWCHHFVNTQAHEELTCMLAKKHARTSLHLMHACVFRNLHEFLTSAYKVSTRLTCQFLFVCFCRVFPFFFSRLLIIGWYICFWQWLWHPTYPSRCFSLAEQCNTQVYENDLKH